MTAEINFILKSDTQLHLDTKKLVLEEKKCTALILEHLQINRQRRLYAQLGYSSLFEYCVKALGYTHSETHRRLSSAKLLEDVPEAKELLTQGKISLTTLAQIQTHLNQQMKLPQQTPISQEEKRQLVVELQQIPTREVEKTLQTKSEERKKPEERTNLPKEKKKHVSSKFTRVHLNVSSETMANLEKAKSYLTSTSELSWDEVLGKLAENFIEQKLRPCKRILSKATTSTPSATTTNRYIPLPEREKIWQRSAGHCEFFSHITGIRCSSFHRLQFAHLLAFSKGGKNNAENIVLMCETHHRMESLQEFPQENAAMALTAGKVRWQEKQRSG